MYIEKQEDGSTWRYNPVTDKASYEPAEVTYKSYATIDPWSYRGIKQELERYTTGISSYNVTEHNLDRRIASIKDVKQRQELENMLEAKIAQYNRSRAEYREQYQQESNLGKKQLVQEYKQAWRSRNAIWKLSHQQFNPKKRNLDKMPESFLEKEIENIRKR